MQKEEVINQKYEVVSNFDMICCNGSMLAGLMYEHESFGVTYVIEDGIIVEKHYPNKIIRGDKNEIRKSRIQFFT